MLAGWVKIVVGQSVIAICVIEMDDKINELFFLAKEGRKEIIMHLYRVSECLWNNSLSDEANEAIGEKNKKLIQDLLDLKAVHAEPAVRGKSGPPSAGATSNSHPSSFD